MVQQRLDVLAKMQGDVVLAVGAFPCVEERMAPAELFQAVLTVPCMLIHAVGFRQRQSVIAVCIAVHAAQSIDLLGQVGLLSGKHACCKSSVCKSRAARLQWLGV